MRQTLGNLWDIHDHGEWVCVTTNGELNAQGHLVMGAGVAKVAKHRYKRLPASVGGLVRRYGNHVWMFPRWKLATFPTKHHWRDPADLELITNSCRELIKKLDNPRWRGSRIYLPQPGCGLGGLQWADVEPVIAPLLDDRVIVVTRR